MKNKEEWWDLPVFLGPFRLLKDWKNKQVSWFHYASTSRNINKWWTFSGNIIFFCIIQSPPPPQQLCPNNGKSNNRDNEGRKPPTEKDQSGLKSFTRPRLSQQRWGEQIYCTNIDILQTNRCSSWRIDPEPLAGPCIRGSDDSNFYRI